MDHRIAHTLDVATARRTTELAWQDYATRFAEYNPTLEWQNDTQAGFGFQAKGIKLVGSLELEPQAIALQMHVPLLLRMFQNKAIEVLEQEIRRWIDRAEAGELPLESA